MPFFFDAYPYTNFHNVNLDWVLQAVKAWGKTVEKNDLLYTELKAAFDDFKKFVQDYLAELDISEEINAKLDRMLEDGTLTPYFSPYIRNYTQQYVNEWLGSHVDPTAPALDDTLTLSNGAAQAAAAGRRLGEAAYFAAWETPHDYTYIKLADVIPGYRLNSIAYDYNGHYYACGGSSAKNGMGFIAVMSKPDFSDAVVTEIPGLGHANDITYDNGYLYVCTANDNGESEGGAPLNAIVKIKADDFSNRAVISNCPENTIGICFVQHGFWILAPYRIYSTTDFSSYTLVVSNIYAMMESYGLSGEGRLVQSLYKSPGHMPALVCAFARDGNHYGAITFFDGASGEAVGFKTFESYQGEVEGAVYGDGTTWIVTDSSGGGATILRSDLLRQRYNLLAVGDDLNDIVGDSISYCTGSNIAAGVLHGPVSDTGYTMFTYRQGLYNTTQVASDNRGKFWHRYRSYTSGAWGEWIEPGAEVSQIKEDLSALESNVSNIETVDLTTATGKAGIVSGTSGNWINRATDFTYFIPVGEYDEKVTITANAEYNAVLCILRSDSVTPNSPPPYATGCGRERIPEGTSKTFTIPADARYITVAKILTGNNYEPESVVVVSRKFATISEAKSITNTLPASKGVENVIRRCRQLTDIKWTPAVDIPRISKMMGASGNNNDYFEDVFKAGMEYKGIPYGQANKNATIWGKDATIGFKVGWTVGLDTFVTAVENPESVVAKESEYTADGSVHRACFYAAICTSLCSYAYDLSQYYTTDTIVNAPGMTRCGLMSNININTIELGNMLWTTKHGAIVTDLIRDDEGLVTGIEISEETTLGNDNWNVLGGQYGGICRRQVWSVSDFHERWDSYGLYRYTNIDSVTYTVSPYVDTGNEGTGHRVFHPAVLPYMGENFEYVHGKIPTTKILTPAYRADALNKLRVLKDGEPWNTDGTTNYYDVSGAYVEVGFADAGTYEAYLCQVVDGSETMTTCPCHWTVI